MNDLHERLRNRPSRFGLAPTKKSSGRDLAFRRWYPLAGASPSPRSHRRRRIILKISEYLCLLVAFICLGYVALTYGGAKMFQSYQSWRLDRAIGNSSSPKSALMQWIDRELSALMPEPLEKPNQVGVHPNAPALEGRSQVPAVRALPPGSLVGRLEIPRVGISVMVLEGDGTGILRKAAGHIPTTALPGGSGNVAIAAHRDTYFRGLKKIRRGDEIIFTTTHGVYHYQVGSTREVGPRNLEILKATSHPSLTLITCYPFDFIGHAPQRFVVQATEVQPAQAGKPGQSLASTAPLLNSQNSRVGVRMASVRRLRGRVRIASVGRLRRRYLLDPGPPP